MRVAAASIRDEGERAKPLAYDAPRCIRCHTRYCDAACQHEHWTNVHEKKCKKIARGGGGGAVPR